MSAAEEYSFVLTPRLRRDVVALYVDARGPYPGIVRDWYDAKRNAMTYRGSLPVVAHPPCGPWSHQSHLHKHAEEIALAPHAVAVVQRCGGVLEHPKGSRLFDACGLPKPGEPEDAFGGRTIEISQCDWGHPARKRTWLYIVGLEGRPVPEMPPSREPTHWCSGGRTRSSRQGSPVPPGIKVCSAQQRRRTPTDFAHWLVNLAAMCTFALSAKDVGAPHKRARCFVVAHSDGARLEKWREQSAREERKAVERGGPQVDTWAAEPSVGRVAYGVPDRVDRLVALGNGCMPECGETIGRVIRAMESNSEEDSK